MISAMAICLLLSSGGRQQKEITYGFTTERYVIEMTVSFPEPYVGRRLVFYNSVDPQKEVCYSGDSGALGKCLERFVGAAALVRYSVRLWNGKPPRRTIIREHVTVTEQSQDLLTRPPFSKTQKLTNGTGSDIQVFGYDESGINESDRILARDQAMRTSWRLCRQELYMDRDVKPFAIVEWKHTVNRISIVRIYSPPPERNRSRISSGTRLRRSG